VRAFEAEAAVGLLRRSATLLESVTFLVGGGGGGCAFRAFARDAAVGANRPEAGVFGLETVEEGPELGVLERAALAGLLCVGVLARDVAPPPLGVAVDLLA
jgi:hypothetical protein